MRKQFIFGWSLLEIKQSLCLYTVEGHLTLKRDMMSQSCHLCNYAIFTHVQTKGVRFEIKGVACHLGNTLANWPYTCNTPKAGVTGEVFIMTHK